MVEYTMAGLGTFRGFMLAITVFWWAVLIFSFTRDRSRYRNCYFLFFALISTVLAATFLAGQYQREVIFAIFMLFAIALLVVPFFLVHNGMVMLRKEGRSLSNMLSLLMGIAIGVGELATVVVLFKPFLIGNEWLLRHNFAKISTVSAVISVSVIYVSVCFLIYMIYSVFLQIIPRKKDFDYVIIHGAGLLEGERVSRLLADRLDKAIEVYHKDPTPPYLIPSGGRGDDENISEAEAMANYLIEKGIPEDRIIREDRSTTTFENLRNSKEIIDSMDSPRYTALVTSNYHVYRALRYCRKVGLKCTGIGSHVTFYYWPSALIREFIAVHAEKKHLITFIIGWMICIASVFLGYGVQ